MASFLRELKARLRDASCWFHRQRQGDHEIWYNPISDGYFTVDRGCTSRHTANETLKQAGLEKVF